MREHRVSEGATDVTPESPYQLPRNRSLSNGLHEGIGAVRLFRRVCLWHCLVHTEEGRQHARLLRTSLPGRADTTLKELPHLHVGRRVARSVQRRRQRRSVPSSTTEAVPGVCASAGAGAETRLFVLDEIRSVWQADRFGGLAGLNSIIK